MLQQYWSKTAPDYCYITGPLSGRNSTGSGVTHAASDRLPLHGRIAMPLERSKHACCLRLLDNIATPEELACRGLQREAGAPLEYEGIGVCLRFGVHPIIKFLCALPSQTGVALYFRRYVICTLLNGNKIYLFIHTRTGPCYIRAPKP
jgi:hypothetical protein